MRFDKYGDYWLVANRRSFMKYRVCDSKDGGPIIYLKGYQTFFSFGDFVLFNTTPTWCNKWYVILEPDIVAPLGILLSKGKLISVVYNPLSVKLKKDGCSTENVSYVFHCIEVYWVNSLRPPMYIGNLTIIGSDNALLPVGCQAIIWQNASEILFEMHNFSFKKNHLEMLPGKCWPLCFGLDVLISSVP